MKRFILLLINIPVFQMNAQFQEVTADHGILLTNENSMFGQGSSFIDFDDDGWDDLTLATIGQGVQFHKNYSGNFNPIYPDFSPPIPTNAEIKGVLWVDYDNDDDKDLIITALWLPLIIYKNEGDFKFVNVSSEIGILPEEAQMSGITAGDIDNDGCLDLFLSKYHNQFVSGYEYSNRVYKNNCDGTFSDVTVSSGFGTSIQASFGSIWVDFNMDGWQDVYVYNDRYNYPNYMYRNDGDGTFSNVTASCGAGVYVDAMSATADDYDNDGDLDIFVSNSALGNVLLNYNWNTQFFTEVASIANVSGNELCWGSMWLDYNNDTWLDLFVGNMETVGNLELQNFFFVSNHNGTFHPGTAETGIEGDVDATYTCAMGDFNQDGYYDYITNNTAPSYASLWQNQGGTNHYLSVSLEGTITNSDGIGTWLTCYCGENSYLRYSFCGENHLGQNSEREIFGLGSITTVDSLVIKWLSGIEEVFYDLDINQHHHFIEGQSLVNIPAEIFVDGSLSLCPGANVVITCNESGTYNWSTGETTQSIVITEPGNYFVIASNEFGIPQYSDTLSITAAIPPEPLVNISEISCNGGSDGQISISLDDGEDIASILWNNGSESTTIENLEAGNYSFTLTNAAGCLAGGTVVLDEPTELVLSCITSNVLCNGEHTGWAESIVSGGSPPYELSWSTTDPGMLSAGTYSFLVMDSLNCTGIFEFEIQEPDLLLVALETTDEEAKGEGGTALIQIDGGTPPYSIDWSNEIADTTALTGLSSGEYSVVVLDAHECQVFIKFQIGLIENIQFPAPGHDFYIYPNPVGNFLHFSCSVRADSQFDILDISGKIVLKNPIRETEKEPYILVGELEPGFYYLRILNGLIIEHVCRFIKN